MKTPSNAWYRILTDNGSYKIVALLVTLILWVTILGRRDFRMTQEVGLEVRVPRGLEMVNELPTDIRVKVEGPRTALKKFTRNPENIRLDLNRLHAGISRVRIRPEDIYLPIGVELLSVHPEYVSVDLRKKEVNSGEE